MKTSRLKAQSLIKVSKTKKMPWLIKAAARTASPSLQSGLHRCLCKLLGCTIQKQKEYMTCSGRLAGLVWSLDWERQEHGLEVGLLPADGLRSKMHYDWGQRPTPAKSKPMCVCTFCIFCRLLEILGYLRSCVSSWLEFGFLEARQAHWQRTPENLWDS